MILQEEEFIALRENKFELHCLSMKLESLTSEGQVFSGSGVVRQASDGQLCFTLYTNEKFSFSKEARQHFIGGHPSGLILPKSAYYRLSAKDSKGRKWVCDRVSPDIHSTEEGTIFNGNLFQISYFIEGFGSDKDFLYLEIFDHIELPYNTPTIVTESVAGKESTSMSLNSLQFTANEIEFLIEKERESLVLKAKSTGPRFVPYFEIRVIEALQFVTSRPLRWSIMIKQSNGNTLTSIRAIHRENLKYNIQPPIDLSLGNDYEFCEIFRCYLEYVLEFQEDKFHPISGDMSEICKASIAAIETRSLILAVGVESILKHVHETRFKLSPEEKEWITKAKKNFEIWSVPENLRPRFNGLISMLNRPSTSIQLTELIEKGAITDEQKRDWVKLRNLTAHGEGMGSASLQEFVDLYYKVLVLFYHLVFFEIGYRGKYSDYSTKGWPPKDYSVTPKSLPDRDKT